MIKLLIAAPEELFRRGVRSILDNRSKFAIVGEASTGEEASLMALDLIPDICILDSALRRVSCLEVIHRIRRVFARMEILVLSSGEAPSFTREAIASGARGFILKTEPAADVLRAIERLSHHETYLTQYVSKLLVEDAQKGAGSEQHVLTGRERQALQMLASGQTNKDIATALKLSVRTVETHRAHIMNKLGVHSITQLLQYSIRNHMVDY